MVKIIHKEIYSNRLKTTKEFEPYEKEIEGESNINSFMILFTQFQEADTSLLFESMKDFCETKKIFISKEIEEYYSDESYYIGYIRTDLRKLLTNFNTIDILDFFDICLNNIDSNIEVYEKIYKQNPYEDSYVNPFNTGKMDLDTITEFKQWFIEYLNDVFEHNNLGYQVTNGIIATKTSDFLHIEVISKPLTLLINEEFNGPLEEFKKAIVKYTQREYEETISEACKAFESTMKCILEKIGDETFNKGGGTAGYLVKKLKENNIFDSFMDDSMSKIVNVLSSGLPTVRNNIANHGDGPKVNNVKRSYASYALNMAGTYIVFLIDRYYETIE